MADTQRERLIDLIYSANEKFTDENINDEESVKILVDYLLEHGVIVPPCKVGDTVYTIDTWRKRVIKNTVSEIQILEDCIAILCDDLDYIYYDANEIVKTAQLFGEPYYLSREDAERALRERDKQ